MVTDSAPIHTVAFTGDGTLALTASSGGGRVWDVATGKEIDHFDSPNISCAAISNDGHLALTGGYDGTVRLLDVKANRQIGRLVGISVPVNSVAFSVDGKWALTASNDGTARIWALDMGLEYRRLQGHKLMVMSAVFSHDGKRVLTGSLDKTARVWDVATGEEVYNLKGYSSWVRSVAISADGSAALVGGDSNNARLWDFASGRALPALQGHTAGVASVAFSPDGRRALTGSWDSTARLWDLASGKEIQLFEGHSGDIQSVAISPDGRLALTGAEDKTVRLWDITSGKEIKRLEGQSGIESVAFSPDGKWIMAADGGVARLWEAATGKEVRELVPKQRGTADSERHELSAVAFSPVGRWALTGGWDHTARLWDLETGKEIRSLVGHSDIVTSVSFSSDGKRAVTGSDDHTARVWELASGKEIVRLEGHADAVKSVVFSKDGARIVTGSYDGTARIWNAETGKWLATLVSFDDGGWAVVDPQGQFDASDPDNMPGLQFIAGDDVIEIGQLKQRFYTPDLLARICRGETLSDVAAGLKDIKLVPGLDVQAPEPGSMEASVRLTNRGGGIGRVVVKVNGREISGLSEGAPQDPSTRSAEVKVNLQGATLAPDGRNVIEVFAENGDGVIRSRGVAIPWTLKAKATPPPSLFAVIVGVARYENANLDLRYSAKDAMDFGKALELGANRLFGKERTHIAVLASGSAQEPTKQNIRRAFELVGKEAHASDVLVVYFAGHGMAARTERDQYYYLTSEARSTDIDRDAGLRAASTVSGGELRQWLSMTDMPLKQVVILDTCAAAAAYVDTVKLGERRDLSPDQIRAIELLKDSTGSWILMGSTADGVSYEANGYAQGLLTYALLRGMQGAALEEERIEVSRLFNFAQRQVEDMAKGIGGIQRPVLSAPRGQTFPIGLLKEEDRRQIHVATSKPELLRVRVLDDNDLDVLKLEPALREELRAASLPKLDGGERREPDVVYLDAVVDEVPSALIPQIRYSAIEGKIRIRLRLLRGGQPAAERNFELPNGRIDELSKALKAAIIEESKRLN